MRIALAQTAPVTGDLEGNAQQVVAAIRRARELGCDLVIGPENAVTGYMSCDLLEVERYVRTNKELLLQRIVPEVRGITAIAGFVDYEEEDGHVARRYNAAAAIQEGRILGVGCKQNLCRDRYYDEPRHLTPGRGAIVVELALAGARLRVGLLVCEDMWDGRYAQAPVQEAAKAGARLLVVINASPYDAGKPARRIERIRELHRSTGLPLIYVNNVGIGDNLKNILVFDGRSMAFDKAGHMVACAPALKEDLLVFDLNEDLLGAPMEPPTEEYDQEVYDTLVFALRSYARSTGFSRALLGMSGGVDSALCAAIAADALGPRNVLGVSLPSRYNAADGQADALAVCRNLGIESAVMPIEELCGHTAAAYGKWQDIKRDVSLQNIQARLRGLLLMAISNEQDRLLIATGNKTEIGQGYCTLYGDTAGAMLLIGDLNKMQVYSLAGYVNRRAGRDVIPESVLQRVPSAELAPGQVDPFDYPVAAPLVDDIIALRDPVAIMQRYRSKSLGERYPADLYERYDEGQFRALVEHSWRLYVRSAFKRAQSAPVVVVSPRAVGFDLRETIINAWRPHLEP